MSRTTFWCDKMKVCMAWCESIYIWEEGTCAPALKFSSNSPSGSYPHVSRDKTPTNTNKTISILSQFVPTNSSVQDATTQVSVSSFQKYQDLPRNKTQILTNTFPPFVTRIIRTCRKIHDTNAHKHHFSKVISFKLTSSRYKTQTHTTNHLLSVLRIISTSSLTQDATACIRIFCCGLVRQCSTLFLLTGVGADTRKASTCTQALNCLSFLDRITYTRPLVHNTSTGTEICGSRRQGEQHTFVCKFRHLGSKHMRSGTPILFQVVFLVIQI